MVKGGEKLIKMCDKIACYYHTRLIFNGGSKEKLKGTIIRKVSCLFGRHKREMLNKSN